MPDSKYFICIAAKAKHCKKRDCPHAVKHIKYVGCIGDSYCAMAGSRVLCHPVRTYVSSKEKAQQTIDGFNRMEKLLEQFYDEHGISF